MCEIRCGRHTNPGHALRQPGNLGLARGYAWASPTATAGVRATLIAQQQPTTSSLNHSPLAPATTPVSMDHLDMDKLRQLVAGLPPEDQLPFASLLAQADAQTAAIPRPPYLPASLNEVLGRYVFPGFRLNDDRRPTSCPSVSSREPADFGPLLGDEPSLTVRIVFAPLLDHLQASIDAVLAPLPADSTAVRHWTRRYINSFEPMQRAPVPAEADLSAVEIPLLAYPVGALLHDASVFKDGRARRAKWERPKKSAKIGLTDWVCEGQGGTQGVLEWKRRMVLPTSDMFVLVSAALRRVEITLRQKGIENPRIISINQHVQDALPSLGAGASS